LTEPWGPLVRQGAQALLEGRFSECERLLDEAAGLEPAEPAPVLLAVMACREQGRAGEAEVLARGLLAQHPDVDEGPALLGAVLADLGRDAEARRQLDLLDPSCPSPPVAALAAEIAAALGSAGHAEALYERLAPHAGIFAGCHGSLARHLGLVCHVLGRWDEAETHFRAALAANHAAGAPVLVAHTRRHYSALLRARGHDGDWERAIELLAQAAAIYRRLEIERLAEEAEVVLRRSQELPLDRDPAAAPVQEFRRTAAGWDLTFDGQHAAVPDAPGLRHIAALLGAEGRPVHAVDLVERHTGTAAGDPVAAEYRLRLAEVHGQLAAGDPVAAALARAERDFLRAELTALAASRAAPGDVGDRARRLVALRIRTSLELIDDVLPALARHLRRSLRTGTFCLYEPQRPERWKVGP
jgi:tetratricopeptide (TPR) repeat protein